MLKISSLHFIRSPQYNGSRTESCPKKISYVAMGILSGLCFSASSSKNIAFAANDDHLVQHAINEILAHIIWEKVGAFTGYHFASAFLGSLLTFQSLGEKDVFDIPKAISKPIVSMGINPTTKKFEYCMTLANGKQIFGQDIIKFYQGLQFIQFIPKQTQKVK